MKDWTKKAGQADEHDIDTGQTESVLSKGNLSRYRTIIVPDDPEAIHEDLSSGIVVAMRGLYAEVDDGDRIRLCTVRRVLRTRLIEGRHPVTVGDRVRFRVESTGDAAAREGVIEAVEPRRGELRRKTGRRTQTIVANVDQVIIVSSANEPRPKPNLIDRYIVATHAGEMKPVVCMNKIDLDDDGEAMAILDRYHALGYAAVCTSAATGRGLEELTDILKGKASVIAGQSGVGKSSLLNAIQPGLGLRTAEVMVQTQKGKHTTTTAHLIRLEMGGYVVDTPGVRSFDLTMIPRHEFEAYFVEFVDCVADCKFPDCTHTHESHCALKAAVERGEVHPERYRSYVQMYEDPGTVE